MKTLILSLLIIFAFSTSKALAQEPYEKMGFVIVLSTKSYSSALKVAKKASKNLGMKLNLRNYYEDTSNGGLKTDEICGCGTNHGYIARGRAESGDYVSIEYSDGFEGFSKGYYIVVVSSGNKDDDYVNIALQKAKVYYPGAYRKISNVYIGCMH